MRWLAENIAACDRHLVEDKWAGVGRASENLAVEAKYRWGSCEPALEPDFQTLSIKLATAVMVHRARAWRIGSVRMCVCVCVLYARGWIRASGFVCACVCGYVKGKTEMHPFKGATRKISVQHWRNYSVLCTKGSAECLLWLSAMYKMSFLPTQHILSS